MNAVTQIRPETPGAGLDVIEMPWGFRMRPADMARGGTDAVVEIFLTAAGTLLILTAFGQWLLPGSLYSGDMLSVISIYS